VYVSYAGGGRCERYTERIRPSTRCGVGLGSAEGAGPGVAIAAASKRRPSKRRHGGSVE
jgi:hypothetical protein